MNKNSKWSIGRAYHQIKEIIQFLDLDLRGMTIITEMASNNYIYSPFIAALAGADNVIAITKDSQYGNSKEIIEQGYHLASVWNVPQIVPVLELSPVHIREADIVTNLGFVRPIAAEFVSLMKDGAVIPYMCEAWEFRPGDVDLEACNSRNIPVMGTNEDYPGLSIFDYCGPLLGKLLFEIGFEVIDNRILILSGDKFGRTLYSYLSKNKANVKLVSSNGQARSSDLAGYECVVVADLQTSEVLVGTNGWIEPIKLVQAAPDVIILQYAGKVDLNQINQSGLMCIPNYEVGEHRMWRTLAYLGSLPVIRLHAAGLKVGELMWRELNYLNDANSVINSLSFDGSLCQPIDIEKDNE
jgi:hypothetical protein